MEQRFILRFTRHDLFSSPVIPVFAVVQYFPFAVIESHATVKIESGVTEPVDRCPADCRRLSLHPKTNRTFDFDSEYRIANPGMTITSTPVILF